MNEDAPYGSIIITPKEFYDGVRSDISEIKETVASLHEELALLPERVARSETRLDTMERRMNRLESRMAWFCGASTIVGATVGLLAPLIYHSVLFS